MCGRYSLSIQKETIAERFGATFKAEFTQRYNVAPGQAMPVITSDNPGEITLFQWGMIPNYSLDEKTAANYFNAKLEQVFSKAPFKSIIRNQRCLVIADGYYEWKKEGKTPIPHRVTLLNDGLFAMAGIFDQWENPKTGSILFTYSIITKPSKGVLSEIHERMPVILPKKSEKSWLDTRLNEADLQSMLDNCSHQEMTYYKSHKIINSPLHDLPLCLEIAPKLYPGETYSLFDN